MARLLIVSRSMALAMRLADQHEVTEHPADELEDLLLEIDSSTDVLVLDLGDPVLAVNTVNQLREAEQDTPVLLVSGYQPEWEQVEAQQVEGVHVVPLPITRVALLAGIAILTGEDSAITFISTEEPPVPAQAAPEPPTPAPNGSSGQGSEMPAVLESEVEGLSYSTAITLPFEEAPKAEAPSFPVFPPPPTAPPQRWQQRTPPMVEPGFPELGDQNTNGAKPNGNGRRPSRLGNRPRKLQRHPSSTAHPGNTVDPTYTPAGIGLVTDPLGPRTDPYGFPASALDRRLDAEAASLASARPLTGEYGVSLRTADLVRLLHERAGDLYGVSDTAQVLADDVIERADADAAAILVPDGPIWRVSGGVGLRPLERRLILEDSHWLITEIGSAGRAVLIEDTDIIRQQLSGAPLAAWRHLLAVPVPDVRAIVVLARGQEGGPFTDRDLSAVIAPVREAAALLAQAVATRRLARVLGPFREADADVPARRQPEN